MMAFVTLLAAASASARAQPGREDTTTRFHVLPALGVQVGAPQKASVALGIVVGEDFVRNGRDHSRNVALFAEPGIAAGRASLAYVSHGYGSFGSGFGVAATVLRTWKDPWQRRRESDVRGRGSAVLADPLRRAAGWSPAQRVVRPDITEMVLELQLRHRALNLAMTGRLYYTDAYRDEFTATVVGRSDDGTRVYLDETAFYPTSGGQPHDLGTIGGVGVVDVDRRRRSHRARPRRRRCRRAMPSRARSTGRAASITCSSIPDSTSCRRCSRICSAARR